MASVVLKTLSILLGIFFVFVGIIKITPLISSEMHREMRKSFVEYTKVFPIPLKKFGMTLTSKWYRRTVGTVELVCGLSLIFMPGMLKKIANIILILMMFGAVYSHWAMKDRFERMAPAIVFIFMLTCRLVVSWQSKRKELRDLNLQQKYDAQNKESQDVNSEENQETKQSSNKKSD